MPESNRRAMTKGTGAWTDRNQGSENFRTFALQYPKGMFRRKTRNAIVSRFITGSRNLSKLTSAFMITHYKINLKKKIRLFI